jgi:Caspase domain
MTLIWQQAVPGPATHAFVIGVGAYPDAKAGRGALPALRQVPDIPSADTGAMRFVDWLVDNCNTLGAPLASIEMLVSNTQPAWPYPWRHNPHVAIDAPTLANVTPAGTSWHQRVTARVGDHALFYICGHGAIRDEQPVVFLADLNTDANMPWDAHIDIYRTANAFRQQANPASAVFFVDACQEFIPRFELADVGRGATLLRPFSVYEPQVWNKVALLTGASNGQLAYEGTWSEDPNVRMGRYTQTLIRALEGASARMQDNHWIVYPGSIQEDVKFLHRLRPDWRDLPFEPSQPLTPNEVVPLVKLASPSIPVVVRTNPLAKQTGCSFSIYGDVAGATPALVERPAGSADEWQTWIRASAEDHLLRTAHQARIYDNRFKPLAPVNKTVEIE